MALRFAGSCKICGSRIAAGETAYWDAGAKTVTCHAISCCEADGLTTTKPLTGPWDQRTDLREHAPGGPPLDQAGVEWPATSCFSKTRTVAAGTEP
jgi:hypothetical protein